MIKYLMIFLLMAANAHAFNYNFDWGGGSSIKYEDITSSLAVSPTTNDFGSKDTGTNTDQVFTVTCQAGGGACEEITNSKTGDAYSILTTNCPTAPYTLQAGESCTATVRFTPASAGTLTGSLVAAWTNQSDVVASLTGVGVATGPSDADIYWDGDHASGTLFAVKKSGTVEGYFDGTASAVVGSSDPGTASANGGYVLKAPTGNNNITFIDAAVANIQQGYFSSYVWIASSGGYTTISNIYSSGAADYNRLAVYADGTVHFTNSSTSVTHGSTATVTSGQWAKIDVRWSSSDIGIRINDGSWSQKGSGFTTAATGCMFVRFGMDGAFNERVIYMDEVSLWATYDQQ